MKSITCCFSGHRNIKDEDLKKLDTVLEQTIEETILSGYCYFGTGGALGFDTLVAQKIIKLKAKYPYIKLILVLPCMEQTKKWEKEDKLLYNLIKRQADKVVYTSYYYANDCMYKRNRHLVDNSSLCICYLKYNNGGTAYTVNYAKKHNVRIINIAELI